MSISFRRCQVSDRAEASLGKSAGSTRPRHSVKLIDIIRRFGSAVLENANGQPSGYDQVLRKINPCNH